LKKNLPTKVKFADRLKFAFFPCHAATAKLGGLHFRSDGKNFTDLPVGQGFQRSMIQCIQHRGQLCDSWADSGDDRGSATDDL